MSDGSSIGARLRAARERRGWTREELAVRSGISWPAISQVESGRRTNLRPTTLSALSGALDVTIDYLVSGALAPTPMMEHSAYFYDDDDQFKATMGSFLAAGLERAEALIAVTTAGNIELLREQLGADARSVEFVESTNWLTTPAAALESFRSFSDGKLRAGAPWVRFVAQPIWKGRSDPEVRLWTRFESLINVLFGASPVTFVCPYDERTVDPEVLKHAHHTHPEILDDAGISESPAYTGPGRVALDP
ncbi:MAG TPA: MEDS domain-containing protein [Thermoleophilaceae bacterium]|nr:MEDS domain-containing protein [Thermoleophilaceae bacterium]